MGEFRRRFLCIAALAIAALFAMPLAAAQPQRILAVGDLHGDYSAWLDIARAAGILNAQGHWAAGNATLFQMGDITDRGPDSLKIIRSLQQLQREAARSGGRVVVILGNHEAMNLLGDNRYTTAGEYAAFVDSGSAARRDRVYEDNRLRVEAAAHAANPALTPQQIRDSWMAEHPLGWVEHRIAWGPSGELGQWATRNPAVAKIDGTLFVHGGLSAEYTRLSLIDINRKVAAAMAAADESPASVLTDPLGPLWYRGLAAADPDAEALRAAARPPAPHLSVDQELDAVLSTYGAQRLVIAHTPDLKGIQITGSGRLARIDTGISRYYGGPLMWLEIVGGKMIPHTTQRTTP
jgi:Calcineurin-like phosphoesterase